MTRSVSALSKGIQDVAAGSRQWRLAVFLAWRDVRQRYRRSILGPFWITISIAVGITTISFVFSRLFKQPASDLIPYLSLGIIAWTFMLSTITESCSAFTAEEVTIKQIPLPFFVHIERVVFRNVFILGHNLLIVPIVLLAFGRDFPGTALWGLAGLTLIISTLCWLALALAILCTRFRDISQIVSNLLQVVFYVSPIIWMPALIEDRSQHWIFLLNPVFHHLELIRAPLLGAVPSLTSWLVCFAIALLGWALTISLLGRFRDRIVYWL